MLAQLIQALYNIVDSLFVGRYSASGLTALSIIYPVQLLMIALGVGTGVGLNTLMARQLGLGEEKSARECAGVAAPVGATLWLIFAVAGYLAMPAYAHMSTKDPQVIADVISYGRIVCVFSLGLFLESMWTKVLQAEGDMKTPMFAQIAGAALNILLDPVLIFGLGPFPALGIEGAALATGIGQTLTLAVYLAVYFLQPIQVRIRRKYLRPRGNMAKRLYAIGIPATLNLALPSLLVSALNAILAAYSQVYILVLGIYYKLQTFLYLPANGIVQGMRPIIGYNYGAGEHKRVSQIYHTVLCLCGGIMLAGTVICLLLPSQLMGLFTQTPETIQVGAQALRIISGGFLVSAVSVASCGALEGVGKGTPSLVISLCRYLVVIVPAAFLLSRAFGPVGVWHAFWVAEALTALVAWVVYHRAMGVKKIKG